MYKTDIIVRNFKSVLVYTRKLTILPAVINIRVDCFDYNGWEYTKEILERQNYLVIKPHKITIGSKVENWKDYADIFKTGMRIPREK